MDGRHGMKPMSKLFDDTPTQEHAERERPAVVRFFFGDLPRGVIALIVGCALLVLTVAAVVLTAAGYPGWQMTIAMVVLSVVYFGMVTLWFQNRSH
jgi:intracellular septation protein A